MAIVAISTPKRTLELVKKIFCRFPRGIAPLDNYSDPPKPLTEIKRIEIKKDIGQAYFLLGMIGPKIDSPDKYACDLLATMLGSGESSRNFTEVEK